MKWNNHIVITETTGRKRTFEIETSPNPAATRSERTPWYYVKVTEIDPPYPDIIPFTMSLSPVENIQDVPNDMAHMPIIKIIEEMENQVAIGGEQW